ncbi:spermatogenesis-associated protein 20 isoform X2 [Fopius arisanus]|nr:PREDICTED: spermatogenesis-associated protein 20 isoform X2 [Fopius arisanus]XP_011299977.1 PREDICTED: spermatogenesis-associated protein 20 isoform X2 [Fopius arisanus]XP_011299978.1 PREDICTED: spermatogenesis-associated protein 20 isoform X2 [Fopius arisanus]
MASGSPPGRNKLALEKSPYLLQHASNPVDWYPWCDEALEKARQEDKLIFLSVGYSTCHWCHVMERESFENESTAQILNQHFVSIKVDREERPDLDKIYMSFIEYMSGHGGWPISIFLTPTLIPVIGGTYFPPEDKFGRPSFKTVLLMVANMWLENKQQLIREGSEILKKIEKSNEGERESLNPVDCANKCLRMLISAFDPEFGGFNGGPKFPRPSDLDFLFHMYARDPNGVLGKKCLDMCTTTLTKIANGGIHDHVGQGFCRYAVDDKWHVPHFEKMLYDQGRLLKTYATAFLATKDEFYSEVVEDIVTYVTRDLRHKDGGYYTAEDADSLPSPGSKEKKEGAFYVWTFQEISDLLTKRIKGELSLKDIYSYHYGVKQDSNVQVHPHLHNEFAGKNVLIVYGSLEETAEHFEMGVDEVREYLKEANGILFQERLSRPRPQLDDKIITAWNGLMMSGLASAGAATSRKEYIQKAVETAQFIERYLMNEEKTVLFRCCYRGENDVIIQPGVPICGFHSDYAFVVQGLIDLYGATFDPHWLELAEKLQDIQDEFFWDSQVGGYFNTTNEEKDIVLRLKDSSDGSEPSSNSVAANNLLRLAALLDRSDYQEKARKIFEYFSVTLGKIPVYASELVSALLNSHDAATQLYIAGKRGAPDTEAFLDIIRDRLIPSKVLLLIDPDDSDSIVARKNELARKMKSHNGRATIYVCRHRTCSLPIVEPKQLKELLDSSN